MPQAQKQNAPNQRQGASSQKRKVGDREDDDVEIILDNAPTASGAPAQKLQKTGRDSWQNRPMGNGTSMPPNGSFGQQQFGNLANFGQGFPAIDPTIILQNIQMLQQMGIPLPDPSAFGMSGPQKSRKKRRRCKDYDKKGFCARGHKCKFEHGTESVFLPSFISPPGGDVTLNYDPSDPSMAMAAMFQPPMDIQFGQQHDRNTSGKSQKSKKQKGKPDVITVNGPVHDRTRTKMVVQNIPRENLSEEQVRDFFSQFGTILDITIQEHRRLAVLNFETWEAANAAWSSPKVIFDNRFVRVFWQKDESDDANGKGRDDAPEETDFDLDEFIEKQAEAQRVHEEKMARRKELEKERQDLEGRRMRHLAEKRELDAKLRSASPSTQGGDRKSSAQTDALRVQLAALEAEADLLGIDPDAVPEDSQQPWWASRGGRGRGGYRGRGGWRGGFASRGGRGGGGPGAVEARHAAYAQYSLDLRPRVVIVSGADFTVPSNDEALRQYLFVSFCLSKTCGRLACHTYLCADSKKQNVGEFDNIRAEPEATHVAFKDRKTAEHFMAGITSSDNVLAGVDEKLELTWGQNITAAAAAAANRRPLASTSAAKTATEEEAGSEDGEIQDDDDDGMNNGGGDFGVDSGLGRDQGDMDYDAGDDWIS